MKWIVSSILALFVAATSAAQSSPTESAGQGSAVNIPFFANDNHGNPLPGIAPTDLSVLDDKKSAQTIVAVHPAKDVPLRVGMLIDTSNSEGHSSLNAPGLKAMADFMQQEFRRPDDKFFILRFATLPEATAFMSGDEAQNLKLNVRAGGGTALWDAIYFACHDRLEVDSVQPARKVLIILSDGDDNQSHVTNEEAAAMAQKTRTVVFAVSTGESNGRLDDRRLKELTEKTGGHAFRDLTPRDMPKVFANIKQQIENMYVVTYIPADAGQPMQYRSVELTLASNKKAKLRAPKGYYVPPPAK